MKWSSPSQTLLAVSLAAALLWRLEVEYHGWDGLIWVSYFHWAIPSGVVMFAAWLAVFANIHPPRKRIFFAMAFVFFSAVAYRLTYSSVTTSYAIVLGPLSEFPCWFTLKYFSIFIVVPLVPILYLAMVKLFGVPITIRLAAISLGIYALAFPSAIFLLTLVNHRGSSDMLHAIKSGFVIPFLIASFGIVFVIGNNKTGANTGRLARMALS